MVAEVPSPVRKLMLVTDSFMTICQNCGTRVVLQKFLFSTCLLIQSFFSKAQDIWGLQFLLSLLTAELSCNYKESRFCFVFFFLYVCITSFGEISHFIVQFSCQSSAPQVPERSNSGFLSQFNRKWHSSLKYVFEAMLAF